MEKYFYLRSLVVTLCVAFPNVMVDAAEAEGPVTISNGHVRLTVNPSVGRIVDFGLIGGQNLMRITDDRVLTDAIPDRRGYQGYGGDQLWPAQQATWGQIRGSGGGWPPLAELDGPNWQITDQGPRHITIQAPETPLLGLTVQRHFELYEHAPSMRITNRFQRMKFNRQREVQIWSVTGMIEPEFTLADISPNRPDNVGQWVRLSNDPTDVVSILNDGNALRFDVTKHGPEQRLSRNAMKLGTHGDWLAAVYEDKILLQRSTYDPTGNFPDNAALEIYSAQDTGREYIELEILSKAVNLSKDEVLSNTVQWHLLDRPTDMTDDQLAGYLASVPESDGLFLISCGVMLFALRFRRCYE